ncbi:MAG: hypothetical protein ACYCYI_07380 [Saccharofermentanales bacterium]
MDKKWYKVSGIISGVLFFILLAISLIAIPIMKTATMQAIASSNEMLEQTEAADMRIDEENRKALESALYKLYDPEELYSIAIAENCFGYAIKVNGTKISKSNVFFNVKGDKCVIELIETTNDNLFPQQILSDISPFSGKNHLKDPAFSVFATTTPLKFSTTASNGKTVETYRFDGIKAGEIFTVRINNRVIREALELGTDKVEITHT